MSFDHTGHSRVPKPPPARSFLHHAQDYRDHRDKIFSKFVSMIEDLVEARAGSLKLTDWDTTPGGRAGGGGAAAAADPSGGGSGAEGGGGKVAAAGGDPCQFTADVRKAVTAMHNILQQQLPPEQLQVCVCVLSMYVVFACMRVGLGDCCRSGLLHFRGWTLIRLCVRVFCCDQAEHLACRLRLYCWCTGWSMQRACVRKALRCVGTQR